MTARLRSPDEQDWPGESSKGGRRRPVADVPIVGTWELDFSSGAMTWSESTFALFGLKSGAAAPTLSLLISRVDPRDRAGLTNALARPPRHRAGIATEFRVRRRGGQGRWLVVSGDIYRGSDGMPDWAAGTVVDVTDLRETQRRLAQTERRQSVLAEMSAVGLWRSSPDGTRLSSPFWTAFTGQPAKRLQKFGWLRAIHPDDVDQLMSNLKEALRIKSRTEFSFRAKHHSGEYRWMSSKAAPLTDTDGSVSEWVGYIQDVSESRTADEHRRHREVWLRLASEAAEALLWGYDLERHASEPIEGVDDPLGLGAALVEERVDMIHPEDVSRVVTAMRRLREAGERCEQQFRVIDADGQTRWLSIRAELYRDARADTRCVLGITQDLTAAKLAEEEAAEARKQASRLSARVEALSSAVGVATSFANEAGEMVSMPGWAELTGQTSDEYERWGWMAVVHPADRERVREEIQGQLETRTGAGIDFRVRDATGAYRWIRLRTAFVREGDQTPSEWIGAISLVALPSSEPPGTTTLGGATSDVEEPQLVSGAQVRAARGLLRWAVRDLAGASQVSVSTIRRIEEVDGVTETRDIRMLQALRVALQNAGILLFRGPDGVGAVGLSPRSGP
jgi:PAS domain S-box-containing protein